jgi:tetratricopeptide (TPR) repeat protein
MRSHPRTIRHAFRDLARAQPGLMLRSSSRRFGAHTTDHQQGSVISVDMDELLERYEALGEDEDFLAAKPLFEAEIRRQEEREAGLHGPGAALLLRQYGYLLNCHGRITIRRAIEQYQRSIDLGWDDDQVQYLWIGAKATLDEAQDAITRYRERVAAAPGDVRALRFLAHSYLAAGEFAAAKGVIDTGLALAPDDVALIEDRGAVKDHGGDPDGALADWRRAHELDPGYFGPVYASAFLLEREGRLAEAAEAWRHILDDATEHGWELTAVWPRQELQRLAGLLQRRNDPGE